MDFKHEPEQASQEAEKEENTEDKKTKPPKKAKLLKSGNDKFKVFKLAGIAAGALAVIIIIILILHAIFSVDGEKIAAELGNNVGKSLKKAENDAKITLVEVSQSDAINIQSDFDCIYESEDMITVDGAAVPEWIIKVTKINENVLTVYYRDFTSQEDYYKGEKLKEPIEDSEIQVGMSQAKVERLFDIKPISITYYSDGTDVCYTYYFINENKDEERRMTVVSYNDIMEVRAVDEIDMKLNPNLE
jgi:hypothetical protein